MTDPPPPIQHAEFAENESPLTASQVDEALAPLLAALDARDATIRHQAEELGRLREQLRALQAPKEEPTAPADPIATTPVFEDYQSQEPVVRQWWRRWFW